MRPAPQPFDAGAFTLDMERRIKLAGQLCGTGFADSLACHARQDALLPHGVDEQPAEEFLAWQRRVVFVPAWQR